MPQLSRLGFTVVLFFFALVVTPRSSVAQESRADTAAVLLTVARDLSSAGQHDLAEELLRYIVRRFEGTPAAIEAETLLTGVRRAQALGSGRTGFIIWNTLFTTWLGLAIPAAFGADDASAYGAGLLVGAPLGFFASKTYARTTPLTAGQGGLYWLSTVWLSWQALGWREVLNIGDDELCFPDGLGGEFCRENTPDTAPWAALVAGGLAGVGAGIVLSRQDIDNGTASLLRHAAFWGTWYGVGLGVLTDATDESLLTWALLGGDAALLAGIPLAKAWQPSPGQVRLITAAGLAGGLAGVGLDLLLEVDDDQTAIAIPLVGTTVGLLGGALMGSRRSAAAADAASDFGTALVSLDGRLSVDLPWPLPTAIPSLLPDGRIRSQPGIQVKLFNARF
jgi:hypothetical protein